MNIVLTKSVDSDYQYIDILNNYEVKDGFVVSSGYVQISEIIDVDFTDLDHKLILNSQIKILDEMEKKEMAESELKIKSIRERKQELLALPGPDLKAVS